MPPCPVPSTLKLRTSHAIAGFVAPDICAGQSRRDRMAALTFLRSCIYTSSYCAKRILVIDRQAAVV
jgi:hypothetical protein